MQYTVIIIKLLSHTFLVSHVRFMEQTVVRRKRLLHQTSAWLLTFLHSERPSLQWTIKDLWPEQVHHYLSVTFLRWYISGLMQGQPAQFRGRRTQMAAAAAGLVISRQVSVITREGKLPLFAIYVLKRAQDVLQNSMLWQQQQEGGGRFLETVQQDCAQHSEQLGTLSFDRQVASGQLQGADEQFLVQYADGRHTDKWHAAREAMGLPPLV